MGCNPESPNGAPSTGKFTLHISNQSSKFQNTASSAKHRQSIFALAMAHAIHWERKIWVTLLLVCLSSVDAKRLNLVPFLNPFRGTNDDDEPIYGGCMPRGGGGTKNAPSLTLLKDAWKTLMAQSCSLFSPIFQRASPSVGFFLFLPFQRFQSPPSASTTMWHIFHLHKWILSPARPEGFPNKGSYSSKM